MELPRNLCIGYGVGVLWRRRIRQRWEHKKEPVSKDEALITEVLIKMLIFTSNHLTHALTGSYRRERGCDSGRTRPYRGSWQWGSGHEGQAIAL